MNTPRTTLYRDKHNAKLMGVCSGIADYTGVNVFWVRMAAFFSMFITGGWSILAYFVAGFVLNKKPPHLYRDASEQKYWQGVRQNPEAHRPRNPRQLPRYRPAAGSGGNPLRQQQPAPDRRNRAAALGATTKFKGD